MHIRRRKILVATTNQGKKKEIIRELGSMPFEFVALDDLDSAVEEPAEGIESLEENAVLKARYYGKKTGLMTIADDTGLFIDALGGWPGVETGRVRKQDNDMLELLFERTKDIPDGRRQAQFRCVTAFYDPSEDTLFTASGVLEGEIVREPSGTEENRWGYNRAFHVLDLGVTYGELTLAEKSRISHRSKSLARIKYFLENQFRGKHIVVPFAIIVKNGKILAAKRNDPHRPEYDNKYEFPGGAVELGESLEENLLREAKEETGYDVEIVHRFARIKSDYREQYNYQIYLVPYVCRIAGGDGKFDDQEILAIDWFDPDEFMDKPKIGKDDQFYAELLPELKAVIREYEL